MAGREFGWTECGRRVAMVALLVVGLGAQVGVAQDIAGTWQGTLQAGKGMRVVLKISKGDSGADKGNWQGVCYNIDEEEQGRVVSSITLEGTTLKFAVVSVEGSYEGKLSADGVSIAGTWTQNKGTFPLNLQRANDETAWAIPASMKSMAADADPAFEVVTIKPSDPNNRERGFQTRGRRVLAVNHTVNDMISFAYGVHVKQIVNGPAWLSTDKYYIDGVTDVAGEPNLKQFRSMIQKLLADRFQFKMHREQRVFSVYALTVGKGGPKLTKSLGNPNGPHNDEFSTSAWMKETNTNMAEFSHSLQYVLDRPVVDQTGLEGRWDFMLRWTPDESQFLAMGVRVQPPPDNPDAPPGLFTAIQEELGLKLEAVKAPVEVLVVDHVERPSAN
jgi:uncharacterized protein (TIGR03435 family)